MIMKVYRFKSKIRRLICKLETNVTDFVAIKYYLISKLMIIEDIQNLLFELLVLCSGG